MCKDTEHDWINFFGIDFLPLPFLFPNVDHNMSLDNQSCCTWRDYYSLGAIGQNRGSLHFVTNIKVLKLVDRGLLATAFLFLAYAFEVHFRNAIALSLSKVFGLDLLQLYVDSLIETFKAFADASGSDVVDYDISIW